ncbi:HlyD family efflux transporter periplasmic adaptor subunit [Polynucleobacter sp. MWH-UH19D]|uniref:HlyD family efflux transporter periplasmic adaptor subunit n=1 Tax=Polynucleobacter sp. MWH-UH19D TaxID=1855610 RepID=UPI0033652C82
MKLTRLFWRLLSKVLTWISRAFRRLTHFVHRYLITPPRRKKLLRLVARTNFFLKHFNQGSRSFLAIRRNRNAVTTGLFLAVLLVPLSSSVNLVGQLGFVKKKLPVETLEGGIILEVNVVDGQFVNQGDVLALLDEPRINSELTSQLNSAAAKACKLERYKAIVELTDFQNPTNVDLIPQQYIERYCVHEKKVADGFVASYKSRIAFAQGQLDHTNEDIQRLEKSVSNEERRLQIQREIYSKKKDLVKQNFYAEAALLDQENQLINAKQSLESKNIELSDRKNKQLDLQRQILDIRSEFGDKNRADYAALISDFESQYASLKYTYRSSQNLRITAPQTGYVTNLKKLRPGILLSPREPLLEIVPTGEDLVAFASYKPADHANIQVGQQAVVRLQTHNQSLSPEFHGKVISVTADVAQENPNMPPMYEAIAAFSCDEHCRKEGFLTAGIPVDIYVLGPRRSLLSYLINTMFRAGRAVLSEPN